MDVRRTTWLATHVGCGLFHLNAFAMAGWGAPTTWLGVTIHGARCAVAMAPNLPLGRAPSRLLQTLPSQEVPVQRKAGWEKGGRCACCSCLGTPTATFPTPLPATVPQLLCLDSTAHFALLLLPNSLYPLFMLMYFHLSMPRSLLTSSLPTHILRGTTSSLTSIFLPFNSLCYNYTCI